MARGSLGGVDIEGVLRRQAGVVSRAQALAAGLSPGQIERRLATDQWWVIRPRVYWARDQRLTSEALVYSALLWATAPSVLSGLAAAWQHDLLPEAPAIVDITVPLRRCLRPPRGIRVSRRDLAEVDRVEQDGVRVTGLPLTILEAAVALGRRGSGAVAALLAAAADRAASAAERKAIVLLRGAAITGWELHHRLAGYELDIALPRLKVAIEIDGWAWHHDPASFRRDRQRQNALVLRGCALAAHTAA